MLDRKWRLENAKKYNKHQGVRFINFGFLKEEHFKISFEMIKMSWQKGGRCHCEEQFGQSIKEKEEDIKGPTTGSGTDLKFGIWVGNSRPWSVAEGGKIRLIMLLSQFRYHSAREDEQARGKVCEYVPISCLCEKKKCKQWRDCVPKSLYLMLKF